MIRRFPLSLASLSLLSIGASFAACTSETIVREAPAPAPTATEAPDAGELPPDAGTDATPPKPRPPVTFPQVLSRGGPTIKTPKVVPIIFGGDPLTSDITSFTAKIGASQYWKTLGAEYNVGPIAPAAMITPAEAAPTTTSQPQIETWLEQKLSGATPAFGTPDANTLYAIYYPATTKIVDDGSGFGESCKSYGGYHYEITVGGKQVAYAVMPRCAGIDDLTVTASHEYFEWATDPFPKSKPAFARLDDQHWAWQVTMIGELGDLCTFLDQDRLRPAEIGFDVQRMWSNKASLAGKYPCAPAKAAPYLQAITEAEDDVDVPDYGDPKATITTKAIRIPAGGSRTVEALMYSDQAGTPVVPVRALSHADFGGGGKPSGFTFDLDKNQVKVGERLKVTINAPTKSGYDILVMAAYTGQQSAHYWPVLVVNDEAPVALSGRPVVTAQMLPRSLQARANRPRFTTLGMGTPRRAALTE